MPVYLSLPVTVEVLLLLQQEADRRNPWRHLTGQGGDVRVPLRDNRHPAHGSAGDPLEATRVLGWTQMAFRGGYPLTGRGRGSSLARLAEVYPVDGD